MSLTDVSVIIPLRDQEKRVASVVRSAAEVVQRVADGRAQSPEPGDQPASVATELLALDERSGDNTLAVLSLLHGQFDNLRTLQDLDPGTSIRRAASVARGKVWMVVDDVIDPRLAEWGLGQVFRGQRAAIVPGELLIVDRALGVTVLRSRRGGLVSAQRAVQSFLRAQNSPPAWSPSSKSGALSKARLFVRGHVGRFGMSWLDKPSDR